jgi:hypothetical protein
MITVPMKVAASNEAVQMTVAAADGITAEIGATYEVNAKLQDGIADPAAELDQENTALIMRGELWRIKKKSAVRNMLEHCCDIYNDHLNP